MVVQQIDFIDVQHPAVRARKQPRRERMLPVTQYLLQVQRSDHPVLGGTDRQFYELPTASAGCCEGLGQHLRQTADSGRLRSALLSPDQHSPNVGSHCTQHQRKPQPVVAHHRTERIKRLGRVGRRVRRRVGRPVGRRVRHSHRFTVGTVGTVGRGSSHRASRQPDRLRGCAAAALSSGSHGRGGLGPLAAGPRPHPLALRSITGGLIE